MTKMHTKVKSFVIPKDKRSRGCLRCYHLKEVEPPEPRYTCTQKFGVGYYVTREEVKEMGKDCDLFLRLENPEDFEESEEDESEY